MEWFTSDTHLGHKNIIVYSKRPFSHVNEMNEAIINNWNERIKPNDDVYHLGDFGLAPLFKLQEWFDRLNGQKHLILGNHDKDIKKVRGWVWIKDYHRLHIGEDRIILFHYGMRVWDRSHHGSIQLYGHSHGSLPGDSQQLDVGVDCWNFRPVNLKEIKARLKTLPERYLELLDSND